MKKQKIIFVHKSKLGDSGEAAIFYYPAMLVKEGRDVMMIARAGGKKQSFIDSSITVFEIDLKKSWSLEVLKIIRNEKPDIVHVFLYSGAGLIPLLSKIYCQSKFILDIRSPLLRRGLARISHRIKNWFEPIFFDVITAHSIESSWTQLGKGHDVNFLPPGVDFSLTPNIIEQREDNNVGPCRLVYIGSLDKLRKPIEMLGAVISAAKSCNIQLDIYGDGSEKQQLEQFVGQKLATDYICFKGLIARNILFKKLPNYDLGLAYIPFGMYDTAPALKTLEYLACGLPVLATSTHGNRMFIDHGVNGFLVDEAGFSNQIIEIVTQVKLSKLKNNTKISVKDFDWEKIVDERLVPIYQDLLKKN